MALMLVFLTFLGVAPAVAFAQEANTPNARQDEYVFVGGKYFRADEVITTPIPGGVFGGDNAPGARVSSVDNIIVLPRGYSQEATIYMDGRRVSSIRYVIDINGVEYEGFCVDPHLPGPETAGAVYVPRGEAPQLYEALKYGFRANPYLGDFNLSDETRIWNAYITRVAVAMAAHPSRTFTGTPGNEVTYQAARNLATGVYYKQVYYDNDFANTRPAIALNGVRHAENLGSAVDASEQFARSELFSITHNNRTSSAVNPFFFEWEASTPAGARLVVEGETFVAPNVPDRAFWHTPNFHLEMPNESAFIGQEAKVYLVGRHNQYAGRVWRLQNQVNPEQWQDIAFFIPYIRSSAVFSFVSDYEVGLRIVKNDPSGQGLAGAVFSITGPDGFSEQRITPANGVINLTGLEVGTYTVTEITPPPGHSLSEPVTQIVNVVPGSTETLAVTFVNQPTSGNGPLPPPPTDASVRIQKICAITRENIPGALMRLRGMSSHQVVTGDGQIWEIDNTGINVSQVLTAGATTAVHSNVVSTVTDGVWTLENLPWGFYMVEEERAPEGFSMYPQHTVFGFWVLPPNVIVTGGPDTYNITEVGPNDNHILITFENYVRT